MHLYNCVHVHENYCTSRRLPNFQHRLVEDWKDERIYLIIISSNLYKTCTTVQQLNKPFGELQVCEVSIVKLNKSNLLIQFSYYLSLLFINKVLQFLFLFLILFIYYLCKRWQALNVSRRVRNATGCWDMLRMSIVIRLLLLDVVVIFNIAVAVIMVGSIGLVRTRAWALFCFKCKICF